MAIKIDIEEVHAKCNGNPKGEYFRAICKEQNNPENPGLIYKSLPKGKVYFYCYAHPERNEFQICKAQGLETHPGLEDKDLGSPDMFYEYFGHPEYESKGIKPITVKWYHPKHFEQWHYEKTEKGFVRLIPNMKGIERILYNLPTLQGTDKNEIIWIVEGEKDVDNLMKDKIFATTFMGGAQHHWNTKDLEVLRNRKIAIYPDNDNAGLIHAWQIAKRLEGIAKEIKILRPMLLNKKGSDITDWLLKSVEIKIEHLKDVLVGIYNTIEKLEPTKIEETLRSLGIEKQVDKTGFRILNHNDPSKSAEKLEKDKFAEKTEAETKIPVYKNYQGSPIIYLRGTGCWRHKNKDYVQSIIQKWTEKAKQKIFSKKKATIELVAGGFDGTDLIDFMPMRKDKDEIYSALQSRNYFELPENAVLPYWLTLDPNPIHNPRPTSENMIVTQKGILDITDLDNIKLRPVTPELLNFAALKANINPENPPPYPDKWFDWLKDWFRDEDAIRHSAKWSALLSRPDLRYKLELYLRGQSNSGKTTWLYYNMQMLGKGAYLSTSINQLGDEYGLADAPGKLAIIIDDAEFYSTKNLGLFLQRRRNISGGTPVIVRKMRQDPFDILLSARLIYASDDLPRLPDSGGQDATRRSVLRFLFNPADSEKKLLNIKEHQELISEMLSAIIWHYTIQLGERALREDKGFTNPENTKDLLEDVKWDTQPYKKFREEELVKAGETDLSWKVLVADVFERWQHFCSVHTINNPSTKDQKTFTRKFMKNTGIEKRRINQIWYFVDVKLRPDAMKPTKEQDKVNPTGEL